MTRKQKQERLVRELQAGLTWYYNLIDGRANKGASFVPAKEVNELIEQGIIERFQGVRGWQLRLVKK